MGNFSRGEEMFFSLRTRDRSRKVVSTSAVIDEGEALAFFVSYESFRRRHIVNLPCLCT